MVIDWVELSKAVPYAAIAIVFGLFMVKVLQLVGDQRSADDKRQDEKDERLAERMAVRERERDAQYLAAIERRDIDWRDFLAQQQILRGEQWTAVVTELKGLTAVVTHSVDLLRAHDSWERGLMSALQQRRSGEHPYTKTGEQENGPNT